MKVGAAVLGLHIVVILAFSLTQGCITTESKGRGVGAHRKGPWKHEYKNKKQAGSANPYYIESGEEVTDSIYDLTVIETRPVQQESAYVSYIVQKGDILSKLAVEFNTTTRDLISLNNLSSPDVLYVGQELRVPAAGRRSSFSSSTSSKTSSSVEKGGQYEIRNGDTLSGIAVAAGVSIDDLRSLNNMKNNQIFAGAKLYIPSYGKVPTSTYKAKKKKSKEAPVVYESAPAPMAPLNPEVGSESVETTSMSVAAVMDHVVYPGETLDDISRQYGVRKSDIMRLNNISDASSVKEGQRLRIPIAE